MLFGARLGDGAAEVVDEALRICRRARGAQEVEDVVAARRCRSAAAPLAAEEEEAAPLATGLLPDGWLDGWLDGGADGLVVVATGCCLEGGAASWAAGAAAGAAGAAADSEATLACDAARSIAVATPAGGAT